MKFVCPESQNRVFLKCGSIASVSALASVGGLAGSSASGVAAAAVWVKAGAACAQDAGAATPSIKASAPDKASPSPEPRRWLAQRFTIKQSIMKMNFTFNIMEFKLTADCRARPRLRSPFIVITITLARAVHQYRLTRLIERYSCGRVGTSVRNG